MKGVFKMLYGYARVSTEDQCLDRQIDALKAAGVKEELIYREKISGTKSSRPKLNALLEVVEKDDIIVITEYDKGVRIFRGSNGLKKPIVSKKSGHEIMKSIEGKTLINETSYEYTATNGFHTVVNKNTYK